MTLDVALLSRNGTPDAEVHIGVESHAELMKHVDSVESPLAARMNDYYRDAEYSATELPRLIEELARLQESVRGHDELARIVNQLIALSETALERQDGLVVLAD